MRVLEKTKREIIDAGFSHIKVELEAQLDRDYEDSSECYECDGIGSNRCYECDGEGAISGEERIGVEMREVWSECDTCYGEGRIECGDCEGAGSLGSNSQDDDWCEQFLLEKVSDEAQRALTYGRFYNDGSVDSEYTFTMPVDKAEYIVEFIKAFKELGEYIGNGLDVAGAGMHVSVIPTEANGAYPSYHMLDTFKMAHFATQVTKLLPALFFTASANSVSRDLEYRYPRVSSDEKYSAIYTHGNTCLEYRLFETCYDKPEAIFEYMEVIAKTLQYMDTSKEVPHQGTPFTFEEYGYELNRFYKTPKQLRVLNNTIKYIKPESKSFRRMKAERGMRHTIKSLSVSQKRMMEAMKAEYKELKLREGRSIDRVPSFSEFVESNTYQGGATITV